MNIKISRPCVGKTCTGRTKNNGGIIISRFSEKPLKGEVLAVGNGTKDEEMVVAIGNTVLYGKYAGTELEWEAKNT